MADDNGTFELSRRKALAGLGTIGVASAGAGLGTSAFFSDTESFSGNQLTAGTLDLKASYSAHYSDWSDDEGDNVSGSIDMVAGSDGSTADLTGDSRVGLPLDESALIAVQDDAAAKQFLANTQYADEGNVADCSDTATDAEDLASPVIDLGDVKPGDFGEVTFCFRLCDNPGYLWLQGALEDADENGTTEPEADDSDELAHGEDPNSGEQFANEGDESDDTDSTNSVDSSKTTNERVELLDEVRAAYWIDDGDNYQDDPEEVPVAFEGTLREVLKRLSSKRTDQDIPGEPLVGDGATDGGGTGRACFSTGTSHCVSFAWWLPVDHANEIQSDSASFSLSFYTEQCRHNDGTGQPAES